MFHYNADSVMNFFNNVESIGIKQI